MTTEISRSVVEMGSKENSGAWSVWESIPEKSLTVMQRVLWPIGDS